MPGHEQEPDLADIADAVAAPRKCWRMQLVRLMPVLAVLIGEWLAMKAVLGQGRASRWRTTTPNVSGKLECVCPRIGSAASRANPLSVTGNLV